MEYILYNQTQMQKSIFSPKLSRWQEITGPLLNLIQSHVKSRTDDTTFVQTAIQVDNNLSSSMIVHNLKFPDIAYMCVVQDNNSN